MNYHYFGQNIRVPFDRTKEDIADQFRKWGVTQWDIRPLREPATTRNGHSAGQEANACEVRWEREGTPFSLRMARHWWAAVNLRILFFAIEALRMNEVRGITETMREAYAQLPAPAKAIDPYEVLGIRPGASRTVAEAAYKALAKERHPDTGGSHEAMRELNEAWEAVKTS